LISKRDLIERGKQLEATKEQNTTNEWNLSPETLEAMAETKRKVDAGLLPKYIGGTAESPSNPDIEAKAKRVYEFSHILGDRKSRVEY
jgi:hypothetical protein